MESMRKFNVFIVLVKETNYATEKSLKHSKRPVRLQVAQFKKSVIIFYIEI